MADFATDVALLWQNILQADHSEAFLGAERSSIDRDHGYDRLPQPGYVGRTYQPGGILIIGQNPGNDAIGKGQSAADLHQYRLLSQLREASDSTAAVSASHLLFGALEKSVMPTWPIVRNVVRPLLAALGLALDRVAYTNLVKFRTVDSSFAKRIYDWSWPTTANQIDLLSPSNIIVLGVGAYKKFSKLYKGSAQHFRVQRAIGDTRLPDEGRQDIENIAAQIRSKYQGSRGCRPSPA